MSNETFPPQQIEWWRAYERVRKSGVINMYDTKAGCRLSGLTRDEYLFCIKHYTELRKTTESLEDQR